MKTKEKNTKTKRIQTNNKKITKERLQSRKKRQVGTKWMWIWKWTKWTKWMGREIGHFRSQWKSHEAQKSMEKKRPNAIAKPGPKPG